MVCNFQLIPEKYRNGIILGYEVSFRKVNGSTSSMSKVNTTLQNVTLPHLDGRHGYTINVQAYTRAGKSPAATIFIPRRDECEFVLFVSVDITIVAPCNIANVSPVKVQAIILDV